MSRVKDVKEVENAKKEMKDLKLELLEMKKEASKNDNDWEKTSRWSKRIH